MAESDPHRSPEGVPEDELDALYGLPLEEFTRQRDALVKELRSAGHRDEAAWVKALRRPSASAWLVNQLARTQMADARRVIESGEALRAAQDRALAGKASPNELSRASEEHAAAMGALLAKAPGVLDSKGNAPSRTTIDRAAETLRAIALDEEARAGFASGRLTRERQASGLGFALGAEPAGRKPARAPKARPEADAQRQERAQAALTQARARHRAQGQKVGELQRALRQAEREAESAQRRVAKAAAALDAARAKQADTQARLEEAEQAAARR
jgi:hypothetical protein